MEALRRFFHKLLHPFQSGTRHSGHERSRSLLAALSYPFAFSSNFTAASSFDATSGKKFRVIGIAPIPPGSSIHQRIGGDIVIQ
jgi:hypothetical protein